MERFDHGLNSTDRSRYHSLIGCLDVVPDPKRQPDCLHYGGCDGLSTGRVCDGFCDGQSTIGLSRVNDRLPRSKVEWESIDLEPRERHCDFKIEFIGVEERLEVAVHFVESDTNRR